MRFARMFLSLRWSVCGILIAAPLWGQDIAPSLRPFLTPELAKLLGEPDAPPVLPSPTADLESDFLKRIAALKKEKKFAEALANCNELVRLDPSSAPNYLVRAVIHNELRQNDAAIADANEAIRLNPTSANSYYWRGRIWNAKKRFDLAIADLDEAIRLDPTSSNAFDVRGDVWNRRNQPERALADCDEAIRLDPRNDWAYVNRGAVLLGQNEFARAIVDLDEAIRLDPQAAHRYYIRARARHGLADLQGAWSDLEKCLRLDPKHALAFCTHGAIRATMGDHAGAIADYNAAIDLGEGTAFSYFGRAVVYRMMQKYESAIIDASTCIADTSAGPGQRCKALLLRGSCRVDLGQFDLALADFQEEIQIAPNDYRGLCSCAAIWATCRVPRYLNGPKAVEAATRACMLTGWQQSATLHVLASAYARCGDFDKAIALQKKAISQAPTIGQRFKGLMVLSLFQNHKPFDNGDTSISAAPGLGNNFSLYFGVYQAESSGMLTFRTRITYEFHYLHIDLPIGRPISVRWR